MTADKNSLRFLVGHPSFDAAMVVAAKGDVLLFDFLAQGNYQTKVAGEIVGYKKRNPNRRDLLNHILNSLRANYSECTILGTGGGKGAPFSPLMENLRDGDSVLTRYRDSGNFRFRFWIEAHLLARNLSGFLKAAGLTNVHQRMPAQTEWPQLIVSEADDLLTDWVPSSLAVQLNAIDTHVESLRDESLERLGAILDAKKKASKPRAASTTTTVYDRDKDVIAYAKKRADNQCEVPNCSNTPFTKRNGVPYVEVHHLVRLADGGPDTRDNVCCLCPSHHREIHLGMNANALTEALTKLRTEV